MTIAMAIKQVVQIYHRRGFKVQHPHSDGQFEHIKKHFQTRHQYQCHGQKRACAGNRANNQNNKRENPGNCESTVLQGFPT